MFAPRWPKSNPAMIGNRCSPTTSKTTCRTVGYSIPSNPALIQVSWPISMPALGDDRPDRGVGEHGVDVVGLVLGRAGRPVAAQPQRPPLLDREAELAQDRLAPLVVVAPAR